MRIGETTPRALAADPGFAHRWAVNRFGDIDPDLLQWIPLSASRVLELGCGDGALAAAYKARNPLGHYTAVTLYGADADRAEAVVDRLVRGDFETMSDAEISGGAPFDAIVLGDVLEYFGDTDIVLARLHRLLAPTGHLVLSVPNISHWTALEHLIHGRWPAEDGGLFDRGHLRFFTLDSLDAALARCGWHVLKTRASQSAPDKEAQRWLAPLADLARIMGEDRQAFLQRACARAYVVVAQKAERPVLPLCHVEVAALAPRLIDVRTRLPAEQLQSVPDLTTGYQEREVRLPPLPVDMPKLLVIQRAAPRDPTLWMAMLAAAIRGGWLVVTELDDHPDLMAHVHGLKDSPLKWLATTGAHAVQTSTPKLAEALRTHNGEVATFPNAAFTLPPFPERGDGPARVFYGALNREGFSGPVAASLGAAIAAYPDTEFTIVHDQHFFERLPTARKRFLPAQPYDAYLAAMAECDIALMPLEGTEAESFKSDVKYVEAASLGMAAIASPTVYADSIRDGVTGLIAHGVADWGPALGRLLGDRALRGALARAAWEEVRASRMFAEQAQARRNWYVRLWQRREELQAALVARLPALRERLDQGR